MGSGWSRAKRHDGFWRMAKKQNYRSRASFKLLQMDARYRLFRPGGVAVDLGASPGGWSQVAAEKVAPDGTVVAVDLDPVSPIAGVITMRGDLQDEGVLELLEEALGDRLAHVVLSDMSPSLTGSYTIDHARSVSLARTALVVARRLLRPRGALVVKVFQGEEFPALLRLVATDFTFCKAHTPKATRAASSETYIVAKGFRRVAGASGVGLLPTHLDNEEE